MNKVSVAETSKKILLTGGRLLKKFMEEALGDENRVSVAQTLTDLNKWLVGADKVWCQGPVLISVS